GPAAAVEIVVDGRPAGRLPGPPWKGTINFGHALLPHGIVARALDAAGHEVGRAEEWANLPHPPAKVEIVLEASGGGPPKAATERTAGPAKARSGRVPPAARLAGWITAAGKPLAVDAVEEGPGKLYVVSAVASREIADKAGQTGNLLKDIHYEMRLGREDQIRFVPAVPERISSAGELSDLFQISPPSDYAAGGLLWFLLHFAPRVEPP